MISRAVIGCAILLTALAVDAMSQATSAEMLGTVRDPSGAVVPAAGVRLRNIDTNRVSEIESGKEGRFRFPLLPIGPYELSVEHSGFARYVQAPIILRLNQSAELDIQLQVAETTTATTIIADAPQINRTNAEVGINFDSLRVSELPLAPDRNILNLALSAPGVSQLSSGNYDLAAGEVNFSVNGAHLRSNNFLIDGQDFNHFNSTGMAQGINNPDIVAEFRLLTSQFAAEYGRAAGSVVNIITKSGTNQVHGTGYWFYNGNALNSRSNLEKRLFESAPWRIENQIGGTLGGPVVRNKTFFFGSALRWTDHRFVTGSISGVPTVEGQSILQSLAGDRPQVKALLRYLPPAQDDIAATASVTIGGQTAKIPLGTLSGAAPNQLDAWQGSVRLDHRFNNTFSLGARYLYDDRLTIGGQAVPPGLTDRNSQRRQSASIYLSSYTPTKFNELRTSYLRYTSLRSGTDPAAEEIPSLEVDELGLQGFAADSTRTAIGLGTTLPLFNYNNNFHISEVMGVLLPRHSLKAGADVRRAEQYYLLGSAVRGRLRYTALQDLVDDLALEASISSGGNLHRFRYYDFAFFFQDEWRARPDLTLTYGIRYESPGSPVPYLSRVGTQVLENHNNISTYASGPWPNRDTNNWAPRLGFNYRFAGGQLILRGGYARTYDQFFNQIFQNVAGAFPFTAAIGLRARTPNSFATIQGIRSGSIAPTVNAGSQRRNTVGEDFRSPIAEQFTLQLERALARNWAMTVGWVASKGTGLFQTVDANPTLPSNNNSGTLRIDPGTGVVRLRCNCASSIYHSLQTSVEKRFSSNFSMALHYTWSTFIDDASDAFNTSANGDSAASQDSFNRHADRGRSTYDRPHRLAANGVMELPFFRNQHGSIGRLAGGWQISGFLTVQSGSPFSPLNGDDPGYRLNGIAGQVGLAIRPNLNTELPLSRMSIEDIVRAGGRDLFSKVTAANPIGNAGRNILRADGIARVDIGINKNMNVTETRRLQLRGEFYNLTNSRDFGIPEASIGNAGFGSQWDTDGGARRVVVGIRYIF